MILAFDHAASEGDVDQLGERLLRPVWIREGIRVAGDVYLVSVDPFLPAARYFGPMRFRLLAAPQIARHPSVVFVACRHVAQEKKRRKALSPVLGGNG